MHTAPRTPLRLPAFIAAIVKVVLVEEKRPALAFVVASYGNESGERVNIRHGVTPYY
jgi:hypothetical protein